jgi:Ca2+:H+ antiporter
MNGLLANVKSKTFWVMAAPLVGCFIFVYHELFHGPMWPFLSSIALIGSVLSAVHHADVIAHRIGEPFGALMLALAVTCIEVSLIVSLMLAGGPDTTLLARDAVFATVMIVLNGMVGLCIFIGGLKHKEQTFTLQGVSATLIVLVTISVLTLILPNYTKTIVGPFYSTTQLIYVALVTLLLYGTFVYVQNVLHRSDFVAKGDEPNFKKPSFRSAVWCGVFLFLCLGAVVLLAEMLAPGLKNWLTAAGAPPSLSGVIIACVVLLPEGLSALRAARSNHLQKSFNLSLGSAIASIGLTIPTVAFVSISLGLPLTLGIDAEATVLFLLSLFIIVLSLSTGKTTILQGVVLLILFSIYLFTIVFP